VSIWQGVLGRRHNRMSVQPYLVFIAGYTIKEDHPTHIFIVEIKNDGLGPAIIEEINISYKTNKISKDKFKVNSNDLMTIAVDMATYQFQPFQSRIITKTISKGAVLSPGSSIKLYHLNIGIKTPVL